MKRIFLLQDFLWFLIPLGLAGILVFFHFFIFSQTWTKKGIRLIQQKKPQSAVNLFVKILEREPFHPYAHLNLGLAYDMSDRPIKALKEYSMILKHFNQDSLQFFASFNRAELHGRAGDLDKALENYQRALAFSIEQDKIKQNIELLFKDSSSQKGKQGEAQETKGQQSQGKSGEGRKSQEEQNTEKGGKSAQNKKDSDSSSEEGQNMKEDEPQEDSSSSKEAGGFHSKQQDRPLSESGSITAGEISKTQAQSIMDEIEEQESNVRARQFQQNSLRQPRRNTDKDW